MTVLSPAPLRPGDTIVVTAPSAGVPYELRARLEVAVTDLKGLGYQVWLGSCLMGAEIVSAPAVERAAELQALLVDPEIRAIVPPWGGDLTVELLPHLDLAAVRNDPTWLLGWSDVSTLLLPLTLQAGIVTAYGQNLMDTPYRVPEPLLAWIDVMAGTGPFTQGPAERVRLHGHDDYETHPGVREWTFDSPGGWRGPDVGGARQARRRLHRDGVDPGRDAVGRPGSLPTRPRPRGADPLPRGVRGHGHRYRAPPVADAAGRLVRRGRRSPDRSNHGAAYGAFTQDDAVDSALAGLNLPVVRDVDCGHVPPHLMLLNGALAEISVDGARTQIIQHLR